MQVVWEHEPPVTTSMVVAAMKQERAWSVQTVGVLMARLLEKGFLRAEKPGKDRQYYPLISREDYLRFETGNFLRLYHGNSLLSLVNSLYDGAALSHEDIAALMEKLKGWDR